MTFVFLVLFVFAASQNALAADMPDGCTTDFAKGAQLFKAVHGDDVDMTRMGQFTGSFQSYSSSNTLRNGGGSLILNVKIRAPFVGTIDVDIPVTVCKRGDKLTAILLTSRSRDAGTMQPQQRITDMVQRGEAPPSITLSITRSGSNIQFSGRSGDTQVSAAAAVR
jgi:hypothetical protein